MKRPKSWYSMSLQQMKSYMEDYDFDKNENGSSMWDGDELVAPTKACIQEIWKIALDQRDITINRFHRELIYQGLESINWHIDKKVQSRFGVFGNQRPIKFKDKNEKELPF